VLQVAPFLGVGRRCRRVSPPRLFPGRRFPSSKDKGAFRQRDPLQSLSSPPNGPTRQPGHDFHGVSSPFNDMTQASPWNGQESHPALDPLAGFLNLSAVYADLSCAALFHAAAVPGLLLQSFPLTGIVGPSRATSSHAVIHQRAVAAPRRPCTAGFLDAHAVRRGCLIPPTTAVRRAFR